ncbi:MAG: 50S ribosomal protein L34 [bacterium]
MPKQTYQPKKGKRAKTHGFLSRIKTSSGRKIVQRRRRSGRVRITA